jgi:hypothetical protein
LGDKTVSKFLNQDQNGDKTVTKFLEGDTVVTKFMDAKKPGIVDYLDTVVTKYLQAAGGDIAVTDYDTKQNIVISDFSLLQ